MASSIILKILLGALISVLVDAVPIENEGNNTLEAIPNVTPVTNSQNNNASGTNAGKNDLEAAASEDKATINDYEDSIDALAEGSNTQNGDGSIYDAFQQYVNRYGGGAYAPYPAVGAYPAPISYGTVPVPVPVPAPYPAPYAVQTAYEGYLVPTSTPTTTSTTTTAATTTTTANPLSSVLSLLNPFYFFTNILPAIMMSTFFRVIAGVLSAIGMVFFSGALTNVICNFTPLCDMTTLFMRHGRAENVGRMLSEELTPERLSQAQEFVRSAIRKYRDLQQVYKPNEKTD